MDICQVDRKKTASSIYKSVFRVDFDESNDV